MTIFVTEMQAAMYIASIEIGTCKKQKTDHIFSCINSLYCVLLSFYSFYFSAENSNVARFIATITCGDFFFSFGDY